MVVTSADVVVVCSVVVVVCSVVVVVCSVVVDDNIVVDVVATVVASEM